METTIKKTCNKCNQAKELTCFCKDMGKKYNVRNTCRDCTKILNKKYVNTKNGKLGKLFDDAKRRVSMNNENVYVDFDIYKKWDEQEGKCFYSNLPMTFDQREWRVSLGRKDWTKNYTHENTILICKEFNGQSKISLDKIKELIYNVELSDKIGNINVEDVKQKKSDMFHHLKGLLDNSVGHNGIIASRNGYNSYDIHLDFLIELFEKQNGKCAYSYIPLRCGTSKNNNWVASLERKNSQIGYTKENVCLICLEFNTADHTDDDSKEDENNIKKSGWSKEKFDIFYSNMKKNNIYQEVMNNLDKFDTNIELDKIYGECQKCSQQFQKTAQYSYKNVCKDCLKINNIDQFEKLPEEKKYTSKECSVCNQVKDIDEFYKSATSKHGIHSICKTCKYNQQCENKNKSVDSKFRDLVKHAKAETKKKIVKNPNTPPCDLTLESLQEKWNTQNGCCYVCEEPMEYKYEVSKEDGPNGEKAKNIVSLYRIDPSKGFTNENTKLAKRKFVKNMKGSSK